LEPLETLDALAKDERVKRLKPLLRQVLEELGEDPTREGLLQTPERWAKALLSYTQGMDHDPKEHLRTLFRLDEDEDAPHPADGLVMVDNIEFVSTCEHHMAPFRGVVHIGYIPNPESRTVVGLSKLSRVVDLFARRLQLQERMTEQIASAIDAHLHPLGVIAVAQAVHYCMIQRGVEQRASTTTTTARIGVFREEPEMESRFQDYLKIQAERGRW